MHVIETDGPELRVRHVPPPEPGRGEVVIEVAAAGVLAGDLDGAPRGGVVTEAGVAADARAGDLDGAPRGDETEPVTLTAQAGAGARAENLDSAPRGDEAGVAADARSGDLDGAPRGGEAEPVTLTAQAGAGARAENLDLMPRGGDAKPVVAGAVVAGSGSAVVVGSGASPVPGSGVAGPAPIPVAAGSTSAVPFVPGSGVAGRVAAVGEGVPGDWLGRRVLSEVDGGYADRVVVRWSELIGIPDGVHEHEAMALLHEGGVALAVFEAAGVEAGETVLVLPASDAVGSLLVQLALDAGARVVGAARGPGRMQLVRDLGVELVVDHGEPGWAEQVGPVDVLFEGEPSAFATAGRRFPVQEQRGERAEVERILRAAADGRVTPLIGQTYPLVHAAEAHAALAARRSVGKTLLIP